MFAIAFFTSTPSYFYFIFGSSGMGGEILYHQYFEWGSMPVLFALLIAANEYWLKPKCFDVLFLLFLGFYAFSISMMFIPFDLGMILHLWRTAAAIEIIIASSYAFLKTKAPSNLFFSLSLISFSVSGIAILTALPYLAIFAALIAHLFLVLIFLQMTPTKKEWRIESYFSLREQLKTVKKGLQKKEEVLKATLQSTADGILVTDENGKVLEMNDQFAEIIQLPREERINNDGTVILNRLTKQIKKPDTFLSKIQQLRHSSEKNVDLIEFTDGRVFEQVSYPLLLKGKVAGRVWNFRDITKAKQYEKQLHEKVEDLRKSELATLNILEDFQNTISSLYEAREEIKNKNIELEKSQEKLKTLNEELEQRVAERTAEVEKLLKQKDEFITQLSHDLKNPLGPIINLLPLLREEETNPRKLEILEVLQRNVDHIKNLVTKTIQLARLNSPNISLSPEETNLLKEINNVIEKNKLFFKEHNIEVENNVSENIQINADKLRLEELLDNIINNAVKYSPHGGTITIDAERDNNVVTVSIKDTGMGMTSEQLRHIFDEFYKADWARHDFNSSGLGLSICKRIVEKHGGRIWVESPGLGKGTTIFFTLPEKPQI